MIPSKKGEIAWSTIVIMVLVVISIIVLLIFAGKLTDKSYGIMDRITSLFS